MRAHAGGAAAIRPRALVREYFRRNRGRYTTGFLLLAGTNLLALAVPRLLKHAVEALQAADRRGALLFSAAIAAVAVAQSVVRTLSRLTILGASRHVAYALRRRLFAHLQRLPMSWYASRPIGDISSRAVNDMMLVRSFFGPGMMNLVNTGIVYVAGLAMLLAVDVRLTLYALAPYPLFLLAVNRLSRRIFSHSIAVQEQLGALTTRAQENIAGINLIKTYAREPQEARRWSEMSRESLRRALALARVRGAMGPLMGIMTSAGTLVVVGLGGRAVVEGRITLGDFVAFNAYLAYLVWPTFAFGWILNTFQRGAAALGRVSEILAAPAEQRDMPADPGDAPAGSRGEAAGGLDGSLVVRRLSFAHAGAPEGRLHLRDVSLEVAPGGTLGILGTVGAGKTTLVSLMTGLLEPPPDTVFVGGRDVAGLPLGLLRRHLAVVPQEPFLFSRSLRANVAFAPESFTDEQILEAVDASRLSRDLAQLPAGLDTVVGERGFTRSGGQRQRATLARALVTRPAVLILDDALSSLDAEVEREALERLRGGRDGRTTVIVSNRITTLSWADEILVMDAGRIVERGTHDQLVARDGLYARIARRQSLAARLEEA